MASYDDLSLGFAMFNNQYKSLLDQADDTWISQGNHRKLGDGIRINANNAGILDICWRVRQSAKFNVFGHQGRYLELRLDDILNVTRKTISFTDRTAMRRGQIQNFLYVARTVRPTKVIVSAAQRSNSGKKFKDHYRGQQAISNELTALSVSLPAYDGDDPIKKDFRFNITCERPGPIVIQIFDVRHCVT